MPRWLAVSSNFFVQHGRPVEWKMRQEKREYDKPSRGDAVRFKGFMESQHSPKSAEAGPVLTKSTAVSSAVPMQTSAHSICW